MSSIKVEDLPEKIDDLSEDDLMIIEDQEDTKKVTLLKLRTAFSMDGILSSLKTSLSNKIDIFISNHNARYKELEDRNKQLEVTCYNLENQHIHDAERITQLENELSKQRNITSDLDNEKSVLLDKIIELEKQKSLLAEHIELLNDSLESNKNSTIELQTQLETLKNSFNELKYVNDELQSTINTLESDSKTNIDQNFSSIETTLSESVKELMDYIRYYHPDVDEIFNQEG